MEEECQRQVRELTLSEPSSSPPVTSSDQKGSEKNLFDSQLSEGATTIPFITSGTTIDTNVNVKEQEEICEENLHDDIDMDIPIGTVCKRKTCGASYRGPEFRESICTFHSGVPIFHEGSKGWSCCRRRVMDFDEFLEIKGCKTGRHRFLEKPFEVR